ncbi:MAG: sulfite exporter TauE/SafE family protein, partial [Actinomycetota bacterium]
SDLYVSSFFIITLSIISVFMVRDARRSRGSSEISKAGRKIDLDAIEEDAPEKSALVARVQSLRIPPMITLKKVNVRVSLWFILLIGFATGFMAGTIGVGGFIGVPAMIYLLGVPTLTAAGTELFIAIFSGAFGAFSYAVSGYVDIKVVLLLYLGSILGVHVGATATKMVDAAKVRMVMALVIILAVVARIFMVPSYLQGLDYINGEANLTVFTVISDVFLFGGGIVGTTMIIISMKKFRKKMAERRRAAVNQMVPHPSKQ